MLDDKHRSHLSLIIGEGISRRLDQMDNPSEEGHVPEADHEPISLANLVLDEKYKKNGVRVLLKLHEAIGNITVTPAYSVYYLDIRDELEAKAKQVINSDSKTNIALVS
jgi:hypothetical protein